MTQFDPFSEKDRERERERVLGPERPQDVANVMRFFDEKHG